jgi:predicted metal-dependent hydrolase
MAPMVPGDPPPAGLLKGIEQFNRGEYFECHETLEDLWRAESRPVRGLYQGILQIGVALYHLRANRYRSVVTLLERGSVYLQPFAPRHMSVNVALLLTEAARCLDEVKRLGPDGLAGFDWSLIPTIEIRD